MLNLKDGTLWQWDIGRKIIITLKEGSTIDKVQFYNGIGINAFPATSIEKVEGEILAGIPNSLLCYAKNLTVYLMTTDADGVKTQEQITLKVNKRAKPEDYIFTDDEFHTYKAYDERLQYLQDNIILPEQLEQTTSAVVKQQVDVLSDELEDQLYDSMDARFERHLEDVGKRYTLLWENTTPNAGFAKTTVNLGKDSVLGYLELLITYKNHITDAYDAYSINLRSINEYQNEDLATGTPGGYAAMLLGYVHDSETDEVLLHRRQVTFSRDGYVAFGDSSNPSGVTSNNWIIPCKIYGVNQWVLTNIEEQVDTFLKDVFVPINQDDYDDLVAAGQDDDNVYYMIKAEEEDL